MGQGHFVMHAGCVSSYFLFRWSLFTPILFASVDNRLRKVDAQARQGDWTRR